MRTYAGAPWSVERLRRWSVGAVVAALGLALAPAAAAQGLGHYSQRNLVSDQPGVAELTDASLVNAWGLAFGPTTPAWVADNGTGVSTLYSGATSPVTPVMKVPLTVTIPGGAPTGVVFNPTTAFPAKFNGFSDSSRFIFDSEGGMITAWAPDVPPPPFATEAHPAVTIPGAVFKGLAIAVTSDGPRLYATDFHNGRVDVFNGDFKQIFRPGAFVDPNLPEGFGPFGIQTIGDRVFVTYAKQDADRHDDVAGPGNGFVDVYDTRGTLLKRLISRGPLNSPWGLALAPAGFGAASGDLLVGNFGNGMINAFNPTTGQFLGALRGTGDEPIVIDGLWALQFGNGVIGNPQTLLFTAGPDDEAHGLFGDLTPQG